MFSIIVCSIRPNEAERLRKNIEETIGVPFEFLAYDNRGTGKGICQVYNECAEKAQYPYLCFVHEDIEFTTNKWGEKIAEKLADPECGVIGFAGSAMKSKALSGWCSTGRYGSRTHYIQGDNGDEYLCYLNPYNEDFSGVVTLDGLCLFVSKNNWNNIRFDEKTLQGFHCYDIDFTIASHTSGLSNWVCNTVLLKHFSTGSDDNTWITENHKLHNKWKNHLPLYIKQKSKKFERRLEWKTNLEWSYQLGLKGLFDRIQKKYIFQYIALHPLNRRSFKLIAKYFEYLRNKKQ